jgi:hypothetical protein
MIENAPPPEQPTPRVLPGLKPAGSPVHGSAGPSSDIQPVLVAPVSDSGQANPGRQAAAYTERPLRTAYPLPTAQQFGRASMLGPLLVLLVCAILWWRSETVLEFNHSWVVDSYPTQVAVEGSAAEAWFVGDSRFEPMARFEIEALLLRKTRYRFDAGARVSPWDFALGWGLMSDATVLAQMRMGHSGRFYRYSVEHDFPWPLDEINLHLANVHAIPANELVYRLLKRMEQGDRIRLRGRLVNVHFGLSGAWRSSLDRSDTGDGACEILWVEYAERL